MQQISHVMNRGAAALSWISLWLAITSAFVLLAVITLNVIGRASGLYSILGAEELSGYILVAVVYFGLGHSFSHGSFINVDGLLNRTRGGGRRLLNFGRRLLAVAFVALLDVYFWRLTADSYRFGSTSIGSLRTPLIIPQAIIVIGTTILLVQILARMLVESFLTPSESPRAEQGASQS